MPSFQPTTDLCDQHLDDVGGEFRVLSPVFLDFGQLRRFFGPVVTVQCQDDNTSVKAALESQGWVDGPDGRVAQVLVVAGGASLRRALMGGKLGAHAAAPNRYLTRALRVDKVGQGAQCRKGVAIDIVIVHRDP